MNDIKNSANKALGYMCRNLALTFHFVKLLAYKTAICQKLDIVAL